MRTIIPDYPHHVVQRGHNKRQVFSRSDDYRYYLSNLMEQSTKLNVQVIAYCLMPNHVHLILVPRGSEGSISRLMKVVAARQTRYFNRMYERSGTLWEGRFKSSIVDTNSYLLACCRYIDLNPVRAYLVSDPKNYRWSSYRSLAGYGTSPIVQRSIVYKLLGIDSTGTEHAYRAYVALGIGDSELITIRNAIRRNQLTGPQRFVRAVENATGRKIETRGRGRPAKTI